MKIAVSSAPPKVELIVAFVTTEERRKCVSSEIPAAEFDASIGSTLLLHAEKTFYVGLGPKSAATAVEFRRAAGISMRKLARLGRETVALDLRNWPEHCGTVIEAMLLAEYEPKPPKSAKGVRALQVWVNSSDRAVAAEAIHQGRIVAVATNEARRIANLPPNLCSPGTLAAEAKRLAAGSSLKVQVLDEKALAVAGCGGILAVGSGSVNPPRLILARHQGAAVSEPWHCIVGKAVTFDTGGLCLKGREGMHEMIWDKCGGAAVFGVMRAVSELKLRKNVLGVIASAENMPDGGSFRPSDILTMADGTTVEVADTDAEGRLVLADAMAYARKNAKLANIVDIATLTGAIGVALGSVAAGVWSSSPKLLDGLLKASSESGERIWHLPSYPEYDEDVKGRFADLRNWAGRLAGASTGAAFLKWFAGDVPWAHLDIGETAYLLGEKPDTAMGATGFGVRLLLRWLQAV